MLSKPKILVCTDFSPYSDKALLAAQNLRHKTDGQLHVLHVVDHPVMWDWIPRDTSQMMNSDFEIELLQKMELNLKAQMDKLSITGDRHVSLGVPANAIIQEVTDKKIDIIVIGHKGRTGGAFNLGSLAEKIVSTSPVPVLVIKGTLEMNKIAALVDPTGPMENILTWAEELTFLYSSRLEVISLFPDIAARYIGIGKLGFSTELLSLSNEQKEAVVKEIKDRMRKELTPQSQAELRVEVSTEKKISYHLNSILTEEKVDLACMQRHQSRFLEKLLIGSETRRLLEIFSGNLLILPPNEET